MLKRGTRGVAVINMKKNLNQLTFPGQEKLTEDNDNFGVKTEAVVKAFQSWVKITPDGVFGPVSSKKLTAKLVELVTTPPVPKPGEDETPWMTWIQPHIGEKEIYGKKDNPFIMSLYPDGNYPVQHDEVPWCACLANAALKRTGFKGTNSAAAKSFDKYGTELKEPKYGAVITLRHKNGGRHVTFFDHWVDDKKTVMACLGGNQGNALKVSHYNVSGNKAGKDEVVGIRWPVKK